MLVAKEIEAGEPVLVYRGDALMVEAMHVPHGIVPAVAFKIFVGGETLVFASDQNGSDPAFARFAEDATILVMHLVIPETATGVASRLHASPSKVGEVAGSANPKQLVLSHFMARSLRELEKNVALVSRAYDGPVIVAEDLACIDAGGNNP
jgi:ribonuclease BN (tRNA processing enzyme)